VDCVEAVYHNTGKMPTIEQMGNGFAWLYLPRNEEIIDKYPFVFNLTADVREQVINSFMKSTPRFSSFEEFLLYAREKRSI